LLPNHRMVQSRRLEGQFVSSSGEGSPCGLQHSSQKSINFIGAQKGLIDDLPRSLFLNQSPIGS
jgi:hypothetical protein